MTPPPLSDFPSITFVPERVLFRIHRTINDPVYFSSSGQGRFDLVGIEDRGTCYMAVSEIGAYVETFGRLGTISEDDLAERSLSEITLEEPVKLANLTNREVLGRYNIDGTMSVGMDYGRSQNFASSLYEAGFDGIYYTARHDPAFTERSVALFGGPISSKILVTGTSDIPSEVTERAEQEFGLTVLPARA